MFKIIVDSLKLGVITETRPFDLRPPFGFPVIDFTRCTACAECARVAARMEEVAELLRGAPRERFRCEPGRLRRLRSTSPPVRHWAGAVVAVVAVVLVTGALPDRGATPQRDETRTATAGGYARVSPLELPIGQRSAMDDFVAPPLHARG